MPKYDKETILGICKNNTAEEAAKKLGMTASNLYYLLKKFEIDLPFVRKGDFDFNIFEEIDTEEKAYWLGFLYADGYVQTKSIGKSLHYRLTLELAKRDVQHIEKFKKFMKTKAKITHRESRETYRLTINSKKLAFDLTKLGCFQNKSFNLKFPTPEQVPNYLMRHFLRGYFDGDGCLSLTKGKKWQMSFLGSYDFIFSLREFIRLNNLKEMNVRKKENIYKIGCSGKNEMLELLGFMYDNSNIHLDRKYKRYKAFSAQINEKALEVN